MLNWDLCMSSFSIGVFAVTAVSQKDFGLSKWLPVCTHAWLIHIIMISLFPWHTVSQQQQLQSEQKYCNGMIKNGVQHVHVECRVLCILSQWFTQCLLSYVYPTKKYTVPESTDNDIRNIEQFVFCLLFHPLLSHPSLRWCTVDKMFWNTIAFTFSCCHPHSYCKICKLVTLYCSARPSAGLKL